ncbi:MAG: diaminopimelate epimerase [Acidimicrobiales bacterium]
MEHDGPDVGGDHWWKLHGAGNDFLVRAISSEHFPIGAKEAMLLADRHYGIGADGVIEVVLSEGQIPKMILRNADGSLAEMSGNGLRCLGHFLSRQEYVSDATFEVMTGAGPRLYRRLSSSPLSRTMVGETMMGEGSLQGSVTFASGEVGTLVDMGNPHLVLVEGKGHALPRDFDVESEGRRLSADFPRGINIEWIWPEDDGSYSLVVYERGVGPTLACGTGTCASFLALSAVSALPDELVVHNPGGALSVRRDDGVLWLGGTSVMVGEFFASHDDASNDDGMAHGTH